MIAIALLSLIFSGWMLLTLHQSVREDKVAGWRDRLSVAWVGAGSLAGLVLAVLAFAGAVLP